MIVEAIINFFVTILQGVVNLLPTVPFPDVSGIPGQLAPVLGWVGWANQYLPVTEALTMLGIGLGVWVVMHLVRLTLWLLRLVHVAGGAD